MSLEEETLEACYIFVISDPYFHTLWPWQNLVSKLPDLKSDRAKWFAVETLAEVCCIGKQSKSSIFQKISSQKSILPQKYCLDFLYEEEFKTKEIGKSRKDDFDEKTLNSSLCMVENVLLSAVVDSEEKKSRASTFNFVPLSSRAQVIKEIALGVAERKHNFITVSTT